RGDSSSAMVWVPAFDSVTRGIAEAHQVPYLSLYQATRDLPKHGLTKDRVHANVLIKNGVKDPCAFTPAGLETGYNVRNLETMTLLDWVKRVVIDEAKAPDTSTARVAGDGSAGAPFVVDALPFVHSLSGKNATKVVYALNLEQAAPTR